MNDIIVARALHVLAVIVWIGGVSMATTVALPALRRGDLGQNRLKAFEAIERRFIWQARASVVIVGLSGLYMTWQLNLWGRFRMPAFWWMDAMVGLWLLFAFVLFIGEPFILQRHFHRLASEQPDVAFARLHRAHWILLGLSLATVFGAITGSHGWSIF
jgi:uncharacterized membrane protein